MQLFTATFVRNEHKFLTVVLQQKLALVITQILKQARSIVAYL